jgi:hypothetical protein
MSNVDVSWSIVLERPVAMPHVPMDFAKEMICRTLKLAGSKSRTMSKATVKMNCFGYSFIHGSTGPFLSPTAAAFVNVLAPISKLKRREGHDPKVSRLFAW